MSEHDSSGTRAAQDASTKPSVGVSSPGRQSARRLTHPRAIAGRHEDAPKQHVTSARRASPSAPLPPSAWLIEHLGETSRTKKPRALSPGCHDSQLGYQRTRPLAPLRIGTPDRGAALSARSAETTHVIEHLFVSEGGLEPPRPYRALAPQASASANSATPTWPPGRPGCGGQA